MQEQECVCIILCVLSECVHSDLQAAVGGKGEKVTFLVVGGRGLGGPSLLDVTGAVQGEGRMVFWAKKFSLAFSASESTAGL